MVGADGNYFYNVADPFIWEELRRLNILGFPKAYVYMYVCGLVLNRRYTDVGCCAVHVAWPGEPILDKRNICKSGMHYGAAAAPVHWEMKENLTKEVWPPPSSLLWDRFSQSRFPPLNNLVSHHMKYNSMVHHK